MPSTRQLFAVLFLLAAFNATIAQQPGSIQQIGETLVSAMMMLVGNEDKIYILDKVEGNPTQINGHPAWAVEWDIASNTPTPMDVPTNPFCSSGMHLPNGSFVTFGGNTAVTTGGNSTGLFDPLYGDYDGSVAIRVLNPCKETGHCQWYDNSTFLALQKKRWYSTAEALADGSVVVIGGFVNGGYVNRNFPNTDPATEGGAAEPTYEFYPANGREPVEMQFMVTTSGLNAYAHAFLMPSGKMFVQANLSTVLWDYNNNVETPLPNMPNGVARVYPASGAVAMLPLTPANNYTPTILFCGGSNMPADGYGSYAMPAVNTWEFPASQDCQRIVPEPTDGSAAIYLQDDNMLEGRTMGQFILLPDGKMLIVNGGSNGTAGYSTATGQTPLFADMPYGMSLASGPVLTPAIYDPNAPDGARWSNSGFQSSTIPRLYHSSAILMPDASVMIAGSNPNVDYNNTALFPTEYRAERFYPSYFATTRPKVIGIPASLSYGGDWFDLTIDPTSYSGDANDAASNTTVVLIRPGFTTHAMNMGQRMLQLNNTFSVADNGTIGLHVSQVPPNPNLLTPGPVFMFVVVHGIPSNGTLVIVGSGVIGVQPTREQAALPVSQFSTKKISGSASNDSSGSGSGSSKGVVIGAVVGGIAILVVLGTILGICVSRRKNKNRGFIAPDVSSNGIARQISMRGVRNAYTTKLGGDATSGFIPLNHYNENESGIWHQNSAAMASSASFDEPTSPKRHAPYQDYDPYDLPPSAVPGVQRLYASTNGAYAR